MNIPKLIKKGRLNIKQLAKTNHCGRHIEQTEYPPPPPGILRIMLTLKAMK